MTAINLALRNLYGYVLHGNSLGSSVRLAYRTGFDGRGFLREMQVTELPGVVQAVTETQSRGNEQLTADQLPTGDPATPSGPKTQLRLF